MSNSLPEFRRPFVASLLAALLMLQATAKAAETGQIVGNVADAVSGQPIANATVSAVSPSNTYRATSDAKGQFSIAGVDTDTYTVSIQAPGHEAYLEQGVTVTANESYRITVHLTARLQSIAHVRARGIASPFQPHQTVDTYTITSDGISQFTGKDFNTSGQKLLQALPSVTVDKFGTPLIRGGEAFQTQTEIEGINYTNPSPNVGNRFQNIGNQYVLNGVGSVSITPGGGDATHGDTGTGLISFGIKRGTWPPETDLDYEPGIVGSVSQVAFSDSRTFGPQGHLSNFFSLISNNTQYQYGTYGLLASSIGASAITPDPNANSNINAHTGSLTTTAFYNTDSEQLRDVLDNLIYKFDNARSLQVFYQHQDIREPQNYGGITGLTFPSLTLSDSSIAQILGPNAANPSTLLSTVNEVYQHYPGGSPGAAIVTPDTSYSPFTAFKLQFNDLISARVSDSARFYRTFSTQQQYQASQGLFVPQNGGTRTGFADDLTFLPSDKHSLQLGVKYEFAVPYGTTFDYLDYLPAYGGVNAQNTQIATKNPVSVIPDFITPGPNTPGCSGTPFAPAAGGGTLCGYLSHFFGAAGVPPLPPEAEVPTAKQQSYALYLQDTYSPNTRLKALLGLRLDGYNFLIPDDPENPPAVDGIRHQRQYEPHLGLAYEIGSHDAVRANFGRTLSIPLPTFLGDNIDRSVFDAYNGIPSYDNSKGPFDPSRPLATAATYCGPGKPQIVNANLVDVGTQLCTSYADQLYWLMRNYRFGLQSLITYPLRGATFTNYDFSYSHEFRDGTALKLTPFYRRGYDVAEQTRTLLGFDSSSEVADLSPPIYANLGVQRATGAELYVAKNRPFGLSYQLSATYINQIGNDPPGTFLPTASLQLGELYRSPELSPFQGTAGLTYRTRFGLRINPILTVRSGYPYGNGLFYALDYNGVPVYIPLTDAIVGGNNGAFIANGFVNPQNPGTVSNPNIAVSRGTESLTSGPGTLHSSLSMQTDLTIEETPPGSGFTFGIAIANLFDQTADIPTVNLANVLLPVSTGNYVYGGTPTSKSVSNTTATGVGSVFSPYIIYPNQPPFSLRAYVQLKL